MAWDPDSKSICLTCERRLVKAGAVNRCEDWRRMFGTFRDLNIGWLHVDKCSHYIGSNKESHIKIYYGPEYADSLTHGGIRR